MPSGEVLVCEQCRLSFQQVVTIGELNGSAYIGDRSAPIPCWLCAKPLDDDGLTMAYWVPKRVLLLYECRMAELSEQKKNVKRRSALEEVQSRLTIGATIRQVFGPDRSAAAHGDVRIVRKALNVLKTVTSRVRGGVEFRTDTGKVSEMLWPEVRYVRLVNDGFEIVDEEDAVLVAYRWCEEVQAAQ